MYGSDDVSSGELRANDGTGKLLVGANNTLPILSVGEDTEEEVAGDVRAREMPGLAAMHTLWVREHNRLCDLLKSKFPTKDEDFYFENARRILIAEMQNIVYSEYLPVVLGENAMKEGKLGMFIVILYFSVLWIIIESDILYVFTFNYRILQS